MQTLVAILPTPDALAGYVPPGHDPSRLRANHLLGQAVADLRGVTPRAAAAINVNAPSGHLVQGDRPNQWIASQPLNAQLMNLTQANVLLLDEDLPGNCAGLRVGYAGQAQRSYRLARGDSLPTHGLGRRLLEPGDAPGKALDVELVDAIPPADFGARPRQASLNPLLFWIDPDRDDFAQSPVLRHLLALAPDLGLLAVSPAHDELEARRLLAWKALAAAARAAAGNSLMLSLLTGPARADGPPADDALPTFELDRLGGDRFEALCTAGRWAWHWVQPSKPSSNRAWLAEHWGRRWGFPVATAPALGPEPWPAPPPLGAPHSTSRPVPMTPGRTAIQCLADAPSSWQPFYRLLAGPETPDAPDAPRPLVRDDDLLIKNHLTPAGGAWHVNDEPLLERLTHDLFVPRVDVLVQLPTADCLRAGPHPLHRAAAQRYRDAIPDRPLSMTRSLESPGIRWVESFLAQRPEPSLSGDRWEVTLDRGWWQRWRAALFGPASASAARLVLRPGGGGGGVIVGRTTLGTAVIGGTGGGEEIYLTQPMYF